MLALVAGQAAPLAAQEAGERIALWHDGVPGFAARRAIPEVSQDWWTRNINDPSLHYFPADPARAGGAAVIIMPGGAHEHLVTTTEGAGVAAWFTARGVAAFVLYYRLARGEGVPWTFEDARQDADRAIRLVRANAARFAVDPHRLGVIGFSAGGELARWTLLNPPAPPEGAGDAIDAGDARPDWGVLVFPGPLAMPGEAMGPDSPPILLSAAADDPCCAQSTIAIFNALNTAQAPAELHLYQAGGHAYNMGEATDLVSLRNWPGRIEDWLVDRGLLSAQ